MKKDKSQEEVKGTDEVKSYDEKMSDYKQHFDDLGMHDPSTEAAIAQMETQPLRVTEEDRDPNLVARDEVRAEKAEELKDSKKDQKAENERLSEVLTDRKAHDVHKQELQEAGIKTNLARGGSEEAETEIDIPTKKAVNKK